jgi:hypothetical protein
MNKPLTMIVKETKTKLINACNESGLPPVILDLIMQGIYSEIHTLAEKQSIEEEMIYNQTIKDKDINNDVLIEGDANESK